MSERRSRLAAVSGWLALAAGGLGVAVWRRRRTGARAADGSAPPARRAASARPEAARPVPSRPVPSRPEPIRAGRSAEPHAPVDPEALAVGHEPESHTPLRWVLLFVALVLVLIAMVLGGSAWLLGRTAEPRARAAEAAQTPFGSVREVPPDPRLQAAPRLDLAALRDAETRRLSTYGRTADGGLHIPIDRAMALVVAEGLPVDTLRGLTASDSIVPTESGWARARFRPRPPSAPAYPGGADSVTVHPPAP